MHVVITSTIVSVIQLKLYILISSFLYILRVSFTIISLIVNFISILFMIKDETGIEILTPISIGIFYVLYFYAILSILTLCIRRLHDSLYSGLWVLLLLVPYLNIFIIYRIFLKCSWDINSFKDIS